MSKLEDAKKILKELGLPTAQQNDTSAYTLLALCGIKPRDTKWIKATKKSQKVSKGIMAFVDELFTEKNMLPIPVKLFADKYYINLFKQELLDYNPDNPKLPVNSPNAHYALTQGALDAIKTFGTKDWKKQLIKFILEEGDYRKNIKRNGNRF
jgi:type II restriction enzyme